MEFCLFQRKEDFIFQSKRIPLILTVFCLLLCAFFYQQHHTLTEQFTALTEAHQTLESDYQTLLTLQETLQNKLVLQEDAAPENTIPEDTTQESTSTVTSSSDLFFIENSNCMIVPTCNATITIPNQNTFAFSFPARDPSIIEADPMQRTTVFFLAKDGTASSGYFYIEQYASTTFCQSSFRAIEGEESELLSADAQTSIFVKTTTAQGIETTSYRPSGSYLIITSVLKDTAQQHIVEEIVQSYQKNA